MFRLVDYFMCLGQQNKAFYQYMNVPEHKLISTPYAVDNIRFEKQAQQNRRHRETIRERLGTKPDTCLFLYSGKYSPKKRPLDLLRAIHKLNRKNLMMIFMGDGALRPHMEAYIHEHALPNVVFTGFINQSQIGDYYSAADVYVMPSDEAETWGLSTNEAMNFSLPLILSASVGCADDLVQPGVNGYIYPCGDIGELANAMQRIMDLPAKARQAMGNASLALVQRYSYEQTVEAFKSVSLR